MMTFEVGELHPSTPHLFSDLIELYVLLNTRDKDNLSESDIESLINTGVISPEDQTFDDIDEEGFEEVSSAEKSDKAEKRVENVFRLLEYRQGCFGDFYPFKIQGGEIIRLNSSNFM